MLKMYSNYQPPVPLSSLFIIIFDRFKLSYWFYLLKPNKLAIWEVLSLCWISLRFGIPGLFQYYSTSEHYKTGHSFHAFADNVSSYCLDSKNLLFVFILCLVKLVSISQTQQKQFWCLHTVVSIQFWATISSVSVHQEGCVWISG